MDDEHKPKRKKLTTGTAQLPLEQRRRISSIGGFARAAAMTPEQRSMNAHIAVSERIRQKRQRLELAAKTAKEGQAANAEA
jgi:hypothetical protein